MRVLYIDSFCPYGHRALNRLYIATMVREGFAVSLALKEGYYEALGSPGGTLKVAVPARWYDELAKQIRSRINTWRALRYIRQRINESDYDIIFLSSYEELSLWAAGFKTPCVMVNHANVAGLDHPLRRWFARRLASNSTGLVYADFIGQRARFHGIKRVQVMPQGLVERYAPVADPEALLRSIDPRLSEAGWQHLVFVPSGAKYADGFIATIIADAGFQEFLRERGILLVVKAQQLESTARNIVLLSKHLSTAQYRALFHACTCLVLHYPPSFTYRVSATLIECFSNAKACLLSNIESFRAFEAKFRYNPFYATQAELVAALDRLLPAGDLLACPYQALEDQSLSFERLAREWCCSDQTPADGKGRQVTMDKRVPQHWR